MSEPTATAADAPKPRSTLQYLVVYPTLLLALGGSVPTVLREVHAWRLGVRSSQLELVQEQTRLWERNIDCLSREGIYEADGPDHLVVKVSLCDSGAVLLRYHFNDWAPVFKWVSPPTRATYRQAPP